MVKNQVNKRRVFIVILAIITVFAIYLVLRGDVIVNDKAQAPANTVITDR